jgi:hypothetical protein
MHGLTNVKCYSVAALHSVKKRVLCPGLCVTPSRDVSTFIVPRVLSALHFGGGGGGREVTRVVSDVSKDSIAFSIGVLSQNKIALHPITLEYSITLLREPQMSQIY